MLESNPQLNKRTCTKKQRNGRKSNLKKSAKITLVEKTSANILDELYNPIDAVNRFINLALQSLEEGSQSRQFLIESKKGIRKTSVLLKRLNHYVKRLEEKAHNLANAPSIRYT